MAHKEPGVARSEPCVALCEPGVASGTDEPGVARSEPCVAQVFLQCREYQSVNMLEEKVYFADYV